MTGMRVSSWLQMKVKHLKILTNFAETGQGKLRVPAGRRQLNDIIVLPPTAQQLVASRRADLSLLIADHADSTSIQRAGATARFVNQGVK